MLRATTIKTDGSSILKLEGKLAGLWVDEVRRCWRGIAGQSNHIQVDLEEVTFVDRSGKELLLRMQQDGVLLVGYSEFLRHILGQDGASRQHISSEEEHHGSALQS